MTDGEARGHSIGMTRSIVVALAAAAALAPLLASPGCKSTQGVGDTCVPEQEFNVTFKGFDAEEVNVESKSFQCQTRLCLVNHFQGRVTCPFGQDSSGNAPKGAPAPNDTACTVPNDPSQKIAPTDTKTGAAVAPQCLDRSADNAVYCSCRCANADGATNDGPTYCACPEGFTCTQLVSPIGAVNEGLTGGYCVKNGTAFNHDNACGKKCDPSDPSAKCGS